jgi:glycosyltransferase involved in cell wall biosynthesis
MVGSAGSSNSARGQIDMVKISVVVAVYNNAGSLKLTHQQLSAIVAERLPNYDLEVVFVNDGSADGSLEELVQIRAGDRRVQVIDFTRNFGQMAAILAGLSEATGDVVINVSADLQDPLDLVPEMVRSWEAGGEIVVCHRADRADSFSARLFSRMAYGILRLAQPNMPDGGFDYVLMDRRVVDVFNSIDVRHRYFQGDLLWTGFRTTFIPYVRQERRIGRSQYNFSKKLKNFLDAVLDVSYLPIRLISLAGVTTSALGMLYGITIMIAWTFGKTPFEGWAPIMIALLVIGGLIMLMLGVIGEYTWRIYEEVRKRPNYIVRAKLD